MDLGHHGQEERYKAALEYFYHLDNVNEVIDFLSADSINLYLRALERKYEVLRETLPISFETLTFFQEQMKHSS